MKEQLQKDVGQKSCASIVPLANSVYEKDSSDLLALQTIVKCMRSEQNIDHYALQAKEIFEDSKILSIVPKLLEVAQVKDLVPILREVEVKKDKSISDYLMINQIYERLGEPEKQIEALQGAIQAAPNDPRPLLLLAAKHFETGHQDKNENLFNTYFDQAETGQKKLYLMAYVLALAYPLALSLGLVFIIWCFALILGYRKIEALNDWHDLKIWTPLLVLFVPPLLALRFWQTGKALPLGALLLFMAIQVFFLFDPILSKIYGPVLRFIGKIFYFVFSGTILAKKLATFSPGTRFLIAFTTLLFVGTIAPTIEEADIRYGLLIFSSFLLYATIGSLMISFLRSRKSLVASLRWIGLAATIPFLISYVVSSWSNLGAPLLYGQMPSSSAISSLESYLVFWGISFFLALHLGKIIAHAFIEPITEIVDKVALIEKGQFDAKVKVFSKDEIGGLGHAINRMGVGLERREKVEKTFRKYVDSQIAEKILDGNESDVRVEGTNVNAVIMFADIRGFTSLAEKTTPEEIVKLLNQFFERMVKIVKSHGGVIDKFIGDNMMVVWGVPHPIAEAEKRAVTAALAMLEEMARWNKELESNGYSEIGIGIGINTGPMIAGSLGSPDHMEYTVIGDTVNTAQRAESIAKKQQLIVTDVMYEKIKDIVMATSLEPIKVKGKENLQVWWSVTGLSK
ncbi:adenylate/guanylate cyclase domain-containing protein [Bdellovibrio sp. HCB337]|uniref:adenylate/guanylate cyclase domain-containing protein n=1 Tax=Bdellovibrio sp. HCB337 TaxID=3394358 RepID=UPI0039A6624E